MKYTNSSSSLILFRLLQLFLHLLCFLLHSFSPASTSPAGDISLLDRERHCRQIAPLLLIYAGFLLFREAPTRKRN